ncbi:MAG: hypothetical protein ACJAVT_001854 [Yoonia sp.]|jgi:hypothetical protein
MVGQDATLRMQHFICFAWRGNGAHKRDLDVFALKNFFLEYFLGHHNYSLELETKTYVRFCLNAPIGMDVLPIARHCGSAPSGSGMLQICEKITVDGIIMEPCLVEISRTASQTDPDIVGGEQICIPACTHEHDDTARDVVKGIDATGAPRFSFVDGMGDVRVIPLTSYFQNARHENLVKSFQLYARFRLRFNSDSFEFAKLDKAAPSD